MSKISSILLQLFTHCSRGDTLSNIHRIHQEILGVELSRTEKRGDESTVVYISTKDLAALCEFLNTSAYD